jgi:error-prone DNA polymerase
MLAMTTSSPAICPALPAYAELHCRSNFSFQIGASHAEELVERAHALGYSALAVTDECSVAGLVRAHGEARKRGLKLIAGAEFVLEDGAPPDAAADTGPDGAAVPAARWRVVALARDRRGWGQLCSFITACRRAAPKGHYRVGWGDLTAARLAGCEILLAPDRLTRSAITTEALQHRLMLGKDQFGAHFWLAAELLHGLDDDLWLAQLSDASAATGVPLLAAGDVVMHVRSRKLLHDVLTAVRLGAPVAQCGFGLQPNAEAHLRPRLRLAALYPPALLAATLTVAGRCTFSLDELRYDELEHELALIAELRYEMYFLTVHDIVPLRAAGASCARGAARRPIRRCATALGITEVDPARAACCSSASSRRSATSRPTSTSISSTSGARK